MPIHFYVTTNDPGQVSGLTAEEREMSTPRFTLQYSTLSFLSLPLSDQRRPVFFKLLVIFKLELLLKLLNYVSVRVSITVTDIFRLKIQL